MFEDLCVYLADWNDVALVWVFQFRSLFLVLLVREYRLFFIYWRYSFFILFTIYLEIALWLNHVIFNWTRLDNRWWCLLIRFFCWRQFGNIIMYVILLSKVYLDAYMYRCHSALISYPFGFSFSVPLYWCLGWFPTIYIH